MTVNPDPKPGRWILPLVILGMVAFTYFFVRSLPEASPDTTLLAGTTTTSAPGQGTTTTTAPGTTDDTVTAYLTELDSINGELQLLETEMVAVNDGFDSGEVSYTDAESRLVTLVADTQALADRVVALTPPEGLEINQEALESAINFCAGAASDALDGLRSSDTGELRRAAVEVYTSSAADFAIEVDNAKAAAGANA